jgi:hypothetical protein
LERKSVRLAQSTDRRRIWRWRQQTISIIKTAAEIEEKRGKRQDKKERRNKEENLLKKLKKKKHLLRFQHRIIDGAEC